MAKTYELNIAYGTLVGGYGVDVSLAAAGPGDELPENIGDALAKALNTEADDPDFNWNSKKVVIPASVVQQIKDDAIREFKEKEKSKQAGEKHWRFE